MVDVGVPVVGASGRYNASAFKRPTGPPSDKLARPENRLSLNAVAEAFLAGVLEGRFEPVGDDFEGSSITVPAGIEHIPRLVEALDE